MVLRTFTGNVQASEGGSKRSTETIPRLHEGRGEDNHDDEDHDGEKDDNVSDDYDEEEGHPSSPPPSL